MREPEFTEPENVQILLRIDTELRDWLRSESRNSGRSMRWIVENAVRQYRNRLEKGRQS